jgi:transcriptional regulator with XRE-family HTH domain
MRSLRRRQKDLVYPGLRQIGEGQENFGISISCIIKRLRFHFGHGILKSNKLMAGGRGFLEKLERNTTQRRKRIAHLLRAARRDRGLTQALVAEVLGWRQSDVSKMEAGHLTPSVVQLEDFALMCGEELDYFATWQAQLEEDQGNESLALTADEFQYRLSEVRKRRDKRRAYRSRKGKVTPPTEPGPLRDAYLWAMEQQEIKRREKQARLRKFPSRKT